MVNNKKFTKLSLIYSIYNIKINNLLIHKNFIVDEISKYYELNDNKIKMLLLDQIENK